MYANEPKTCNEIARQPIAVEVAQYAQNIANRAQVLADRVHGKLHSVMTSETPRTCGAAPKEGMEEYPPLFSDLRDSFQGIESALEYIESAMSRTEL